MFGPARCCRKQRTDPFEKDFFRPRGENPVKPPCSAVMVGAEDQVQVLTGDQPKGIRRSWAGPRDFPKVTCLQQRFFSSATACSNGSHLCTAELLCQRLLQAFGPRDMRDAKSV